MGRCVPTPVLTLDLRRSYMRDTSRNSGYLWVKDIFYPSLICLHLTFIIICLMFVRWNFRHPQWRFFLNRDYFSA